jgi:hypothetical protein
MSKTYLKSDHFNGGGSLDTVLTPVLFLTFGRKPLERLAAAQAGVLTPAEAF